MSRDVPFHPLAARGTVDQGKAWFLGRPDNLGGLGGLVLDVKVAGSGSNTSPPQLIKKLLITTGCAPETTNARDVLVLEFRDAPADTVRESLPFMIPSHNLGASPLSARDHYSYVWEPQAGIIIPSGWYITADYAAATALESQPFGVMFYGVPADDHDLRSLGYSVASSTTAAQRDWIQTGIAPTSDTTTSLVAARANKCIYISDILVIMSPTAANATVQLETSDGRDIFRWVTGAVTGQPVIRAVKCDIFVDQPTAGSPITNGYGLQVTTTNCANRCSIIVLGRYIDYKDVPDNAWWTCVTPATPTANSATTLARTIKAAAGAGRKHIILGWEFSAVRDGSSPISINMMGITYGSQAPGSGSATNFTLSGNVLMSPIFALFGRDEAVNVGIGGIRAETISNAAIFIESMGGTSGIGTPAAAGDIIDMSCTVWGYTDYHTKTPAGNYQGS